MPHYLTVDQPGIGGQLKREPADFVVEEIPLYLPSGKGQHVYITVEKQGLSTYAAVRMLARALDISPKAVGYAGLKDAQAITRQTFSLDSAPLDKLETLNLPNIKILQINRHKNKLKIGHLAGNRFIIRIREVGPEALPQVKLMLETLSQRGVPNFFGAQRFGNRANNHVLGELLVRQQAAEFVAEYLGRPQPHEAPPIQEARRLFDAGDWSGALQQWSSRFSDERRVLAAIIQSKGQFEAAFKTLNRKLKNLLVSAFQAQLFNELLAQRVSQLEQLETGDVAYIHNKGAAFIVEDPVAEQIRADQFEISPSGPLFGPKILLAEHKPGQHERACLARRGLSLQSFKAPGLRLRGVRRPYRIKLMEAKAWWDQGLYVSFNLPPGTYATTVMAEIMKNEKS